MRRDMHIVVIGVAVLLFYAYLLIDDYINNEKETPPKTVSFQTSTYNSSEKSNAGSYSFDGEAKINEDAALIGKASLIYKKHPSTSKDLIPSIKKGCRVMRARYRNTYSPSPKIKSVYEKADRVCDYYF